MTASDYTWLFGAAAAIFGIRWFERFSKRIGRIFVELERRDQQQEREDDISGFQLPAPSEHGWDNICVNLTKRRYERTCYLEWPPQYQEVLEYDLRPQDRPSVVFARLIDMWEEYPSGDEYRYLVINGTICERANEHNSSADLEKRIVWHELRGPERYIVLSAHGIDNAFFVREQERIQKALKQLTAQAEELGAVQIERHGWIRYEPAPDAGDEQKSAIEAGVATLCSDESLRQLEVSREEVFRQDCAFVLSKLAGGRAEPVASNSNASS
jgi:hypothetical protein